MAPELRELIEKEHGVVGQGPFAQHGGLVSADQNDIGDSMMGGTQGAHGREGGAPAGETINAVDAGGFYASASVRSGRW